VDILVDPQEILSRVRNYHTQKEIADYFGRDVKTVKRWEAREDGPPQYAVIGLQQMLFTKGQRTPTRNDFTFIDLFAGIGGMRMGFEEHGGRCVYTSEWDNYAQKTYLANFAVDHEIAGDITKVAARDIPDHDVLVAGFPCQPFSIAGVSKKNSLGRKHGFECDTQGTLFFDVARIIKEKRPKAFLLENVKNLKSHDKGNTFNVILRTLKEELGYKVFSNIIDAKGFVPQHRERIFIAGFREDTEFTWDALQLPKKDARTMADVFHTQDGSEEPEEPYTKGIRAKVNDKYILSDKLWNYLQAYAAKHKKAGNGFGYGLVTKKSVARTLSARYYKDGSEILVSRGRGNPRRLTPRECARLMGYDHGGLRYQIPVSDTRAYKQFGNGVAVPVVCEIARIMKPFIMALKTADMDAYSEQQQALFVQ
jgi:DNA (cytosine-5)-methyltransferase 1